MATVVLQYAGAALGTFLGGPVGGIIGRAAGAIAGNIRRPAALRPRHRTSQGPRLNDLRVMASDEGAAIPRLWGRMRISGPGDLGQQFRGGRRRPPRRRPRPRAGRNRKTTDYSYFANFAVGLCEGEVDRIGRVWADGKEIDLSAFTTRSIAAARPGARQPDRGQGGRGQCARLSRPCLYRVRAAAAGRISATACRSCPSR